MKNSFLRSLLILLLLGSTIGVLPGQQKLVPFQEKEKWGYRDEQGRVVIEPQFTVANDFSSEGIAAVLDNKGWAYIDKKGNVIIRPFVFDNGPDYFQEGLARFTKDEKFGFFDQTGKVVITPQFDFAAPFSEGLAAICIRCKSKLVFGEHTVWEAGEWRFVNRKGETVIAPRFESARGFENGKALVQVDGQQSYIDKKGKPIMEDKAKGFDSIGSAHMDKDGVIQVQIHSDPSRRLYGGVFFYSPWHPEYQEILQCLGGLEKGQEKPVPSEMKGKWAGPGPAVLKEPETIILGNKSLLQKEEAEFIDFIATPKGDIYSFLVKPSNPIRYDKTKGSMLLRADPYTLKKIDYEEITAPETSGTVTRTYWKTEDHLYFFKLAGGCLTFNDNLFGPFQREGKGFAFGQIKK